ncbi:MAG: hypothetical protein DCO95_09525 [Roseivirga sp. XM-24bin3]|nr:MAG: hypothetical protein DCO95_09525 [Roseivirga sp. XM-24bin3]
MSQTGKIISYDQAIKIIQGDYSEKEKEASFDYLIELASDNDILSSSFLGCEYINGFRLKRDVAKGLKYLQVGINGGSTEALLCLARYQFTEGEYYEYSQSIAKGAELGNTLCQVEHGNLMFQGKSNLFYYIKSDKEALAKYIDFKEGLKYLKKISSEGVSEASFILGKAYFEGKTIEKNNDMARQYFKKCLEDNDFNKFDIVQEYLEKL